MKNKIIILLLSVLCCASSAIANDMNSLYCLNQEWQHTSPSQDEKIFDSKNDFDINGYSISCYSFLTPSEVRSFISKLKDSVNSHKKSVVADLIKFPLRIAFPKSYVSELGNVKIKSGVIQNKDEFLEKYDAIFSETLIGIVDCMELAKLNVDSVSGLSIAYGKLWFNRTFEGGDQREIKITSISLNETNSQKWLDRNCAPKPRTGIE
jgi:hypothetical protein